MKRELHSCMIWSSRTICLRTLGFASIKTTWCGVRLGEGKAGEKETFFAMTMPVSRWRTRETEPPLPWPISRRWLSLSSSRSRFLL